MVESETRIAQEKVAIEEESKMAQLMLQEYQKKILALENKRKAVEKEEKSVSKKKEAAKDRAVQRAIDKASSSNS
jgi:hypothetical protein